MYIISSYHDSDMIDYYSTHHNIMRSSVSLTALLLLIVPILGWSDVGHMLVSRIAEINLMGSNITQYNDFSKIIDGFSKLTDGKSNTFVEASVWADDIKNY